jgi:predicted enzyme related to lactoylglutathione lyase
VACGYGPERASHPYPLRQNDGLGKLPLMAPVARLTAVVLDCPDPHKLAEFYGEITGWRVEYDEPEWVTLNTGTGLRICFQESPDHVPPVWPDPTGPQQAHLDFAVEDLDEAEERVLALGAVKPDFQPGETWRVYADPAGHPFCLYEED